MTSFGRSQPDLPLVAVVTLALVGCPRQDPQAARTAPDSAAVRSESRPAVEPSGAPNAWLSSPRAASSHARPSHALAEAAPARDAGYAAARSATVDAAQARLVSSPAPRTIHFAWRPPGGNARVYAGADPEDQHRLVLTCGVVRGGRYPVVIAFHGQPRRGQAPRDYAFVRKVTETTLPLVQRGEVEPLVLAIPVFRFEGQEWPDFDLVRFTEQVTRLLQAEAISVSGFLLFGHSAAAGCGGRGLNEAARIHPVAVGFFDTCVGPGFGRAVRALRRDHVPTLLMHSVETAGFRPRQLREYMPDFDFGKVYRPLGLEPMRECPQDLPEAPLRSLAYHCAADPDGTTRAFVVDTGQGQQAHDDLIPVAVRYFLRQYAARRPSE